MEAANPGYVLHCCRAPKPNRVSSETRLRRLHAGLKPAACVLEFILDCIRQIQQDFLCTKVVQFARQKQYRITITIPILEAPHGRLSVDSEINSRTAVDYQALPRLNLRTPTGGRHASET